MKRIIHLKQIAFILIFLGVLTVRNFGQTGLPVYDKIAYAEGILSYDNLNWWCLNSPPVNDITISQGSLSYNGLLASDGNKLSIGGAGDEAVIYFGTQPSDSKVYYSLIFQVTSLAGITAGTPTHFAGFSNASTTSSSWGCSIIIQADASDPTKFNIGHGTRSSLPVWSTIDGTPTGTPVKYSVNTPVFIVACYEIIGSYVSGTPNDKSSMWINPLASTFENTVAPAASITGDLTGTGVNDINTVNRIYLRQDAATTTPPIEIDEIRVGLTWAGVTPKSIATATYKVISEKGALNIYPNPAGEIINVDLKGSAGGYLEIYNLTGQRIMTRKVEPGLNNVNINSVPEGSYIVKFKGPGMASTTKLVKK